MVRATTGSSTRWSSDGSIWFDAQRSNEFRAANRRRGSSSRETQAARPERARGERQPRRLLVVRERASERLRLAGRPAPVTVALVLTEAEEAIEESIRRMEKG